MARTAAGAHTAASSRMGPSGQPACDADQGQAPAFLHPRQPLLVHAGGVDFQPQRCRTRLHFDLVLPALTEEVIEQVRGILHAVDDIADP